MLADQQKGPKSFAVLLDEVKQFLLIAVAQGFVLILDVMQADLQKLPPDTPTYLTAAMGPPTSCSARKWCSVCGNLSP